MTVTLPLGNASADASPKATAPLRLQVLGPLRLWRGEVELDPGPRQQAHLLALLLARGDRPTGPGELIDLIWGETEPVSALNVIHKYIGSLRRLLEPELPPRRSGSYLLRGAGGYLCAAGPEVLDVARFRHLVGAARAESNVERAVDQFLTALRLWRGPAGDGLPYGPTAAAIFAGLDDEFCTACVEATDAATAVGRSDLVLPALRLASSMAPLNEPVQASLVVALGAAGRQAEALTIYDRVRHRLAEELGIDPGVDLRSALTRVLDHSLEASRKPRVQAPSDPQIAPPLDLARSHRLVGRSDEVAALRCAVAPSLAAGTAVVLLEGEPGVGKTRLLEEVSRHAEGRGALVVWGQCLEGSGTPALWPWAEVVMRLLADRPTDDRKQRLAGELGRLVHGADEPDRMSEADGLARFHLLEELLDAIGQAASERPLVIVLDDLQWADASSLQVLDHVVARMPGGTAFVGALRNRGPAVGADLARTLAAASRVACHRRFLVGPLDEHDVAELVACETGGDPASDVAGLVHARTAGNPFFVREVARLLVSDAVVTADSVLRSGVPVTVRDVVRDRVRALDSDCQDVLEAAALVGRNVEIVLLARASGVDVPTCLDRLEPVRELGMIAPVPGDPYTYRFTHDLVREAVSEAVAPGRAAALHGRIAETIEAVGPSDASAAERIAHHLWAAGPLSDPLRTVSALLRAGACALSRTALVEAETHYRHAVGLARAATLLEPELEALSQLIAVVGMRSMYGTVSVELMERAEEVASLLGRERDAAGFLFSRWAAHVQGLELDQSRPLARRLLDRGTTSDDPVVRMYGEAAWGIQQWQIGEVGESYRCLNAMTAYELEDRRPEAAPDPVRDGLRLLMTGMFAEISAYHGDAAQARAALDAMLADSGGDPYAVTVVTSIAARAAAVLGDAAWALAAAERGLEADPRFSYVFLGTYTRLARCWASATTGGDAATAATEAERLIAAYLTDPVRSCISTWHALLAEMHLAAGSVEKAAAALDRADELLERHGQRPAEALVLTVRAELAAATGDTAEAVRLAEAARELALTRQALAFVERADRVLAALDRPRTLHSSSTAHS